MKVVMHRTKIGLPEKNRIELVEMLNETLASTIDLYTQLKQAHWNIKGKEFIALHKLLDEIAEVIEEQVDIVAEQITALGGTALGTIDCVIENTDLEAYPIDIFSVKEHLDHLTHNFAILGELSRVNVDASAELEDVATNDVYIQLVRVLDKNLWLLEAQLQ